MEYAETCGCPMLDDGSMRIDHRPSCCLGLGDCGHEWRDGECCEACEAIENFRVRILEAFQAADVCGVPYQIVLKATEKGPHGK